MIVYFDLLHWYANLIICWGPEVPSLKLRRYFTMVPVLGVNQEVGDLSEVHNM